MTENNDEFPSPGLGLFKKAALGSSGETSPEFKENSDPVEKKSIGASSEKVQ